MDSLTVLFRLPFIKELLNSLKVGSMAVKLQDFKKQVLMEVSFFKVNTLFGTHRHF